MIFNLIFILLIIVGITIVIFQLRLFYKGLQSKDWHTTQGEIISSEVETFRFDDESNKTYRAGISFKYMISGKEYISSRVFFGDKLQLNLKGKALKLVYKYPVRSRVEVFYNPDNVEESVLEKGISSNIIILLIIGIVMALLGFVLINYYPELSENF